MKIKVGTLIEEEVIKLAKHRALEDGRPLSDVIQEAIVTYLSESNARSQKAGERLPTFL